MISKYTIALCHPNQTIVVIFYDEGILPGLA